MRIANQEISIGNVATLLGIVGSIAGSVIWMVTFFATADDVKALENTFKEDKVEIAMDIKEQTWNLEQTLNDTRIDILEDRIYREKNQSVPDTYKLERLERQIKRLETRQDYLEQLKTQ